MYHVAMAPSSLALGADPHTLCALTLECLSCLCSDTWVTPLFVTLVSLTRPCPSAGVRYDLCSLPPLCRLVSLCLVLPCRALSCFAALSCPLLFSSRSCLVLSCLLVSSCRVSFYLILSYLILSYLILSYLILSHCSVPSAATSARRFHTAHMPSSCSVPLSQCACAPVC